MIAPSTDIYLLKTNIELDNANQLIFRNKDDQWATFSRYPKLYLENATYQRKDGILRYPLPTGMTIDELYKYNYCIYRNENYGDKWFYAFIKEMKYINDGMIEITLETDVWQTWQFDMIYKRCYVERETVSDDTFGKHTLPEGLDTGKYMYQQVNTGSNDGGWYSRFESCRIVFAMSDTGIDLVLPSSEARTYNGVFSGLRYFALKTGEDAQTYIDVLQRAAGGKIDGLYAIFMAPDDLLGVGKPSWLWYEVTYGDSSWWMGEIPYSNMPLNMGNCVIYDRRVCGTNYKPKNNKLLCFPYRYINVSNNAGQSNQYYYELFTENNKNNNYYCGFTMDGSLSIGCSIKLCPSHYDNPNVATEGFHGHNYLEGIDCYKLPTCSWVTDPFLNWISTNAVNLIGGGVASVAEIGTGIALSAANPVLGLSLAGSGAMNIFETMKTGVEKALEPDTARGGGNLGELNFKRGFTPYCMSIRDEYAKIIDDYFSMFGYKVNSLKLPELFSRRSWNYIKTIDCNYTADIPQEDLQKIKAMFNNGITFWHDVNTFYDYSQPNYIV